jgi:DNA-binding response OmpR family regulator
MLVLSRDGAWLSRLDLLAERGGWPFEARAAVPAPGRTPPPERALVVLDRGLAGAVPAKAVSVLRSLYPGASIALAFDGSDMSHDEATAAVSCGADEVIGKSWPDEKLSSRLAVLRDRSLFSLSRLSADGALKAERRAHRAHIKVAGRWRELAVDAGAFALLWRLLEREGESVSRAALGAALASAVGRELEIGTVTRRIAALKKALAPWPGTIEGGRGGLYRLASAPRRGA